MSHSREPDKVKNKKCRHCGYEFDYRKDDIPRNYIEVSISPSVGRYEYSCPLCQSESSDIVRDGGALEQYIKSIPFGPVLTADEFTRYIENENNGSI